MRLIRNKMEEFIKKEKYDRDISDIRKRLFALENKPKFKTGDVVKLSDSYAEYTGINISENKFIVFGTPYVTNDYFAGHVFIYHLIDMNDKISEVRECSLELFI